MGGRWRTIGDLAVHIPVKAIERGAHHAFQFAFGPQFDARCGEISLDGAFEIDPLGDR